MNMLPATLATLRRPRLLVRAARFGLGDYRRERDLARLMQGRLPDNAQTVLAWLIDQEQRMEAIRQSGDAGYSTARHIELLIALMAEARLICDFESQRTTE
ncbi:hypothetical protein DSD19_04210 [Rhodovulum sp. BSW8]|uniref:Uncharacterized protein n=1 Tax=Rhodovulum visakhapatnamense TaxID=364297 RepID=A0A4R8FD92_9RHOB|nr:MULTISPECIES: DUF6477 family protein [Rhodovulum]OLS44925.1 hypothetical protein BV509_11635 [Rhodovulum sulfidophilum]MBL3568750.1 hypothetical protein [Rhodovulum visakhapatnamense]MBL3580561.1 hypothetical protein [Rhodovulum visakhapatnamense]RBO54586.1 hypothetical protein DSD19_04210 [Rhodovulum sp. BSW8]TDX23790.1 hypothetical protein EV657_12555 [Rhodovulum visakhapatnamense]